MRIVLAIDPGQEKCGLAVVSDEGLTEKLITPRDESVEAILSAADKYQVDSIIIGDGTGSKNLKNELMRKTSLPIIITPEEYTTLKARKRYFNDHPPKGFRRLIPSGMLTPEQPYDDYAALIIAEEYLKSFSTYIS